MEFIIIREETPSPEPEIPKPDLGSVKSLNFNKTSPDTSVMSSHLTDDEVWSIDLIRDTYFVFLIGLPDMFKEQIGPL